MEKNICIVHYNTPELTLALVKSIRKTTPDCNIFIFDNSDKKPFPKTDGVTVFDNTKGKLVNFKKIILSFPKRNTKTNNNYGSDKHAMSVDKLFDLVPNGFVLLDSDVLVKKDLSGLFDETVSWCGRVEFYRKIWWKPRVIPFCCWINVPMLSEKNIRCFSLKKNWELNGDSFYKYDTGSLLFESCQEQKLPFRKINEDDFVIHFRAASWRKAGKWKDWLNIHKDLYL